MMFRHTFALVALLPLLLGGCANGSLCPCSLFPEAQAAAAEAPPPPAPEAVAPAPVASPPPPRKIVLRGVNFGFDKDEIREEDKPVLDAAIEALKENPNARVQIAGYTDDIGPEAYNQGLSERRADAVRDYLVNGGVDAQRLDAMGRGMSSPVADNSTRDGRAQNRRVELQVE